jgi:hypothetical protein
MPTVSERGELIDYLKRAYANTLRAEMHAALEDNDENNDDDADLRASQRILSALQAVISQRYLRPRRTICKSEGNMKLLLEHWKTEYPDIFRSYVRISPDCFDALLAAIKDEDVFHNNSQNEQMPVAEQLAIALYRFGHFGNAASITKTALFFGVGFGTVDNITKRVMTAVCRDRFRKTVMRWPDAESKENAKGWVEAMACPGWRDGWLMVDGTLVPLFGRPLFFGNSWFDRKHNYSMNTQVSHSISTACLHTQLALAHLNPKPTDHRLRSRFARKPA